MTSRPWVAGCVVFGLWLSGCAELTRKQLAEESREQWGHMRAKVKLQLAQRSFEKGNLEEAGKQCNEVLQLDPEFTDGYILATRIYLEKGDVGRAVAALESAKGLGPDIPEVIYLQGMVAERQGRVEEALKYYEQAYRANQTDVDYLLTYAECLLTADQYKKAIDLLEPRHNDFEQTPAVHILMGQAYTFLKRYVPAAEAYQTALHLAPNNRLLREEAGTAFLAAGWNEEAVETLTPLLRGPTTRPTAAAPSSPPLGIVRTIAAALMRSGNSGKAIALLEESLKKNPQEATLLLLLAEAHLRAGDLARATDVGRQVVRLDSEGSEGNLLLAYCALELGRATEAAELARKILTQNPRDIEARAVLAKALEKSNKSKAEVAEQYRRILSIAPDQRWAQAEVTRLSQ